MTIIAKSGKRSEKVEFLPIMKNFFFLICILTCFAGCRKHSDTQISAQVHEFKGIIVINDIGQMMGSWGTEDGDWETDATWTAGEYELLNFPDTVSMNGTFIRDTTGWNIGPGIHEQPQNLVIVFPNPVKNSLYLYFQGFGLLKFKAAIVDKNFNRLFTYACKDGSAHVLIDLSDAAKFQSGVLYRMYYSLSVTDSLNFYKGHGDILICMENTLQDCQKFVP
jgi:hypothetical protein